jgi:hypothetical protein
MSSFKKNVTFEASTIFIEPSGNRVVPRLNPPFPLEFKRALWYSQRELAYIEYVEYREQRLAIEAAAVDARNNLMPVVAAGAGARGSGARGSGARGSGARGSGAGGPRVLVFK